MDAPVHRLPYPGLRAFTREESDLFFGREGSVNAMVDRLAATRFLAVLGASGSGKSSLVRTGLLDALNLGLHPWAGSRWRVADFHPGGQPVRNLATALLETKGSTPDATDVDLLTMFLGQGPRSVIEWARGGNLQADTNLLILVDQFEELFRYSDYAQREESEAFVALLLECASTPGVAIHVIITMRSEYLGACALIPGLAERLNAGLYLTPRMGREECREAIVGPAGVMGFTVEPALVNRLLNDLASFAPWESTQEADQLERLSRRADQLPLMQHVLNQLWIRQSSAAQAGPVELKLSDYEQLGGLSGALDAHGGEVMAALGADRADHVEEIFRALVTGTSLAQAVRRACRVDELVQLSDGARDDVVAILKAFCAPDCNFIRASGNPLDGDVIVDISHESLIRQWTPLTKWLDAETRDGTAWRRLLAAQQRHHQREGGLLTGLDLHNLAAWWESAKPTPTWASRHGGDYQAAEAFLEASRRAESAEADAERIRQLRERNRLRVGIASLAVVSLVATGLFIWAWTASRSATQNARRTSAVLDELSDLVYSDRYNSLVGLGGLQSELMKQLVDHQADISKQHSNVVAPANVARAHYRQGLSLESEGKAATALSSYERAYEEGRNAMALVSAAQQAPDSLATFIDIGYRYSWFLFDIGEAGKGEQVLKEVKTLLGESQPGSDSARLLIAYGRLESLQGRIYSERKQPTLQRQHNVSALGYGKRAVALPDAGYDATAFLFRAYWNMSWRVDAVEAAALRVDACALADRMFTTQPMDARSIAARVDCLTDQAGIALRSGNRSSAREKFETAVEVVSGALRADSTHQEMLLLMADLENELASISQQAGQEQELFSHRMAAKNNLVLALKGRTLFQANPLQVKTIYNAAKSVAFAKAAMELEFYTDVAESVAATLDAFPKAPSFAYVAADASYHIGDLLKKEPARLQEAATYLSRAIDWFDKSGAVEDLSVFSEDIAAYCAAYSQRAHVYGATQRIELMLRDIESMKGTCTRALDKYPWDFYLRGHLFGAAAAAGKTLFDARRYLDAAEPLKYASHWGVGDSSRLLARMHREGLGIPKDVQQADVFDALASKQSMKRFTIPTDFGGTKAPFHVYIREWPSDYPFLGIDDQITWVKEARGGVMPSEVGESFRKLHKIARDNGVSFPDLAVYAFGEVKTPEGTKPASESAVVKNNQDVSGGKPAETDQAAAQFKIAQSLNTQGKWEEAAQALEKVLTLNPRHMEALQLADWIYHEHLFRFDRAFDLNAKREEIGVGSGGGKEDIVEKHLTTGRFNACATRAAARHGEVSEKRLKLVLSAIRFACLSGEQKGAEALAIGRQLRQEVSALERVRWTFSGTKHFVKTHPAFAAKAAWVSLFEALELGDEAKALAAISALGVPK